MEKLKELQALVASSIYLSYNDHKGFYESVREYWFDSGRPTPDIVGDFDMDNETDVWAIQVYTKTPISFYYGISNDLYALIQWAIDTARSE